MQPNLKISENYSYCFNIDDVLSDICCFTINDIFTYLDNFNFIKNCVNNCVFTFFFIVR